MVARSFPVLANVLRDVERRHVMKALALTKGRKGKAAELLGISRKNLWEKLRAFEAELTSTPQEPGGRVADAACRPVGSEHSSA
jgi:DNA-binding NtrC family response regulator